MDIPPESTQHVSDAGANYDPQAELSRLLDEAKPESEDWQEIVGKLVSEQHLKTLQPDVDDKVFLQCACLVVRSQAAGSKIAPV